MAFSAALEMVNGIAKITLMGELDASVAGALREKIEQANQQQAKRLVLLAEKLTFMSSAGLRTLVFARQKMGAKVEIFVVAAPPQVVEPIQQTGFSRSVILLEHYDAARIDKP
jgi:anti-anti-sigma factor